MEYLAEDQTDLESQNNGPYKA